MTIQLTAARRGRLLAGCAAIILTAASAAHAADAADGGTGGEVIVTVARTARSSVELSGQEAQKLLPGMSPLKAVATLPGVIYETADPWGNNEQNLSIFVHGFSTQQLAYTMDGVPRQA